MTVEAMVARSSQVHVLSSGISRPACFSSSGLTPTEKSATPTGAPTRVPPTLPVSSTLASIAERSSTDDWVLRSSSASRPPYAAI